MCASCLKRKPPVQKNFKMFSFSMPSESSQASSLHSLKRSLTQGFPALLPQVRVNCWFWCFIFGRLHWPFHHWGPWQLHKNNQSTPLSAGKQEMMFIRDILLNYPLSERGRRGNLSRLLMRMGQERNMLAKYANTKTQGGWQRGSFTVLFSDFFSHRHG